MQLKYQYKEIDISSLAFLWQDTKKYIYYSGAPADDLRPTSFSYIKTRAVFTHPSNKYWRIKMDDLVDIEYKNCHALYRSRDFGAQTLRISGFVISLTLVCLGVLASSAASERLALKTEKASCHTHRFSELPDQS